MEMSLKFRYSKMTTKILKKKFHFVLTLQKIVAYFFKFCGLLKIFDLSKKIRFNFIKNLTSL